MLIGTHYHANDSESLLPTQWWRNTMFSDFGFEIVPFPDEVFRENPLEAGDGGHVLSIHPSQPIIFGALYNQPEFDSENIYFVPAWSHYALRIGSSGFRQSKEFLRKGTVVFKKMFYSKSEYMLPPHSWARAYIYQTFQKDGKRMTRGDEGFTGYTTIVSTRPYDFERACPLYIRDIDSEKRHLVETPTATSFQTKIQTVVTQAMTHTPSLSEATFTVEIIRVDTKTFCDSAEQAMQDIEKLSPTLPEDGKSIPSFVSREFEPTWARLFEGDVPSRLLHDFVKPSKKVTPFLLVAKVNVVVRGCDFGDRNKEQRYNEEMSKLLMDIMRVDNNLLVVGERRDTVLRGVRRNQFRGARSGYGPKEGDDGSSDVPDMLSILKINTGGYIDKLVSLYGNDYSFSNSCTKREGYAERVKTNIDKSPLHDDVKTSTINSLYAALYNPIVSGSRKASRYRSPKYFKTEILDQMLYWAAIYPGHLASRDQTNERVIRPIFARWYLDWGVRIGKFFTPLGSRQHNGKFHILFLFDGHRTLTTEAYEPPYHLYTHVGNNIMFRGVSFHQYTRAGTKNMHRCNNVTLYGGVHHVPPDAEKEDPWETCFRKFSECENIFRVKMYELTTHISGRSVSMRPSTHSLTQPLTSTPSTHPAMVQETPVKALESMSSVEALKMMMNMGKTGEGSEKRKRHASYPSSLGLTFDSTPMTPVVSFRPQTSVVAQQRVGVAQPIAPTTSSLSIATPVAPFVYSSGIDTPAMGIGTSAMGIDTPAMGIGTSAMGIDTPAMGIDTPAMGIGTSAMGIGTPAMGIGTPVMADDFEEDVTIKKAPPVLFPLGCTPVYPN